MIDDILAKRKHVMEYDTDVEAPKRSLINSLLQRAWKVTPTKNNLMPYKIHVLGPEHQHYKNLVFLNSCKNEIWANSHNKIKGMDEIEQIKSPAYENIKSCAYLLIFQLRLAGDFNPYQQSCWDRGVYYDPATEEGLMDSLPAISIECGMFATALCGLCLENRIDASYTLNFSRTDSDWKDLPFVDRRVLLLMTLGKGKKYRQNDQEYKDDFKPDYHKIINFID